MLTTSSSVAHCYAPQRGCLGGIATEIKSSRPFFGSMSRTHAFRTTRNRSHKHSVHVVIVSSRRKVIVRARTIIMQVRGHHQWKVGSVL